MGIEYKIKFAVPSDYDPSSLFRKLPSPIDRRAMTEIYNYSVEKDGFYFVDRLVIRDITLDMASAVNQATETAHRWAKWLEVVPLVVFLVASQVARHEESQMFAAGNSVQSTARPATLNLKGKVFYVTDDQRRMHQASQSVAFVSLAALFGWLMWIRRPGRRIGPSAGP